MTQVDLARRRPALQSSTCAWSTDASRAVDAATAVGGDADSPRWLHTGEEFFPWWRVDLGADALIRRIEIENRPDQPERLSAFTVSGSLDFATPQLARHLRVRLDGYNCLHFRQFRAFGEFGDAPDQRAAYAAAERAWAAPEGRQGRVAAVGGFDVFIDDAYGAEIRRQLGNGDYERNERQLACELLRPGDRVIEAGTAIGLVSMTAAAIVGAENVVTFDANPAMTADAAANFARNDLAIAARNAALVSRARFVDGERLAFHVSPDFWASRLSAADGAPANLSVPTRCFEAEAALRGANVLICDIEGGEVDLLMDADLAGLRLIILETHTWAVGVAPTQGLIARLMGAGFALDLDRSREGVAAFSR